MSIEISVLISIGCAVLGAIFGYKNSKKQDIKEVEEKTRVMTEISMTLQEVAKDVKFIMEELTNTKDKINELTFQFNRLESGHNEVVRDQNRLNDICIKLTERIEKLEEFVHGKFSV